MSPVCPPCSVIWQRAWYSWSVGPIFPESETTAKRPSVLDLGWGQRCEDGEPLPTHPLRCFGSHFTWWAQYLTKRKSSPSGLAWCKWATFFFFPWRAATSPGTPWAIACPSPITPGTGTHSFSVALQSKRLKSLQRCGISPEAFNPRHSKVRTPWRRIEESNTPEYGVGVTGTALPSALRNRISELLG